jgi:hypothetical protein
LDADGGSPFEAAVKSKNVPIAMKKVSMPFKQLAISLLFPLFLYHFDVSLCCTSHPSGSKMVGNDTSHLPF